MTKIRLHGILKYEFGDCFEFKISKPKEALFAIEANRPNFRKRILDLYKKGFHYTVLVDGKKVSTDEELNIIKEDSTIDLVPVIVGGGPIAPLVGAIVVAVVVAAIGVALALLLAPKPPEPPDISVTARAFEQSFIFSNKANIAVQGVPVPVGYGRLRIGTSVVQACVKNFPRNQVPQDILAENGYNAVDPFSYADGNII